MKLTTVLLTTGETSTVLLTFKTTGTTTTSVKFLTSVSFSLEVTLTLLVKVIAPVTFTRAETHKQTTSVEFKPEIIHLPPLPKRTKVTSIPLDTPITPKSSTVKPAGKLSTTVRLEALPKPTLDTQIVKLTTVLLTTGETSTVLLTFKTTGTTVVFCEVVLVGLSPVTLLKTETVLLNVPKLMDLNTNVIRTFSKGGINDSSPN